MPGTRRSLQQMDCPFNWECPSMATIPIEQHIKSLVEKTETISNENQFQWTRCTLNLILAYEISSKLSDYHRALTYINKCESHVRDLLLAGCKEPLFVNVKKQLTNILKATKAHILFYIGNEVEALKILSQFKSPAKATSQSPVDRAALLGIKAAVFLYYGTTGHHMALQCAKEASNLDPEEAEWQFIVGNAMGRIRHVENGEIDYEMEFKQVEKACSLRQDATYIVHLASQYSEYSTFLYFNKDPKTGRVEMEKSESFAERAIGRFKEALTIRPNCSGTMARVAHGMIRIRHKKLLDMGFVKNLLDRVVELAPHNCMVYHDLGLYYEKYENNFEKAVSILKRADDLGNWKALTYIISLKWKHGKQAEIVMDILNGLNKYSEKEQRAELYATLGAAYILIENDWGQGVQHLTQSLQVDDSAKYLLAFWGFSGKKTNLLDIMVNEVSRKLETEKNKTKQDVFNLYLKKCKLLNRNVDPRRPMSFQDWVKIQRGAVVKRFK